MIKKIFQFATIYVCFVKIIVFGKTIGYSDVHYFHYGVHSPKEKGGWAPLVVLKKTLHRTYTTACIVHRLKLLINIVCWKR